MGIIEKLNERFRTRHQDSQRRYWDCLAKVARSGGDRATGALVAEIETAATALGKSPEVIEADLELLEESIALADAPKALERATQAVASAKKDYAAAMELAAEHEKKAQAARSEGEAVFNAAVGAKQLATQRFQELTEAQNRLADAGHPDHKHNNQQAREIRVNVESAQTELRVVDAELATFTQKVIDSDRNANKAYNMLKLRRARLVEDLHRQGSKTTAEPVLDAGDTDDDDEPIEVVTVPREEPLGGLALMGEEGKSTILEDDEA